MLPAYGSVLLCRYAVQCSSHMVERLRERVLENRYEEVCRKGCHRYWSSPESARQRLGGSSKKVRLLSSMAAGRASWRKLPTASQGTGFSLTAETFPTRSTSSG